jgi:hypothetical protein
VKRRAVVLVPVALALTGCSSGLTGHPASVSTPSTPSTPVVTQAPAPVVSPRPNLTFQVTLSRDTYQATSGWIPVTSRHRRGPPATASIRVLAKQQELCWSFSKSLGVAHPRDAHINLGAIAEHGGTVYVQLGARYARRGCTKVVAGALAGLAADPPGVYYLVIDGPKRPFLLTGPL